MILIKGILDHGKKIRDRHDQTDAKEYSDFNNFKKFNEEMLRTYFEGTALMKMWCKLVYVPNWSFKDLLLSTQNTNSNPQSSKTGSLIASSPLERSARFLLEHVHIDSSRCSNLTKVLENSVSQKKPAMFVACESGYDDCLVVFICAGQNVNWVLMIKRRHCTLLLRLATKNQCRFYWKLLLTLNQVGN